MLRVMHRMRMSSHDAHYAGELVDGARCLALFGDVATELCIRADGDVSYHSPAGPDGLMVPPSPEISR